MRIKENVSLKGYNTFGIDVRASRMVEVESVGDCLGEAGRILREDKCLVLGSGSDVVFTADYDGTVVRMTMDGLAEEGDCRVTADAGWVMDDLIATTLQKGLYGLENLTAIPGTVGAAVVQNVGAYGIEAKDVVESVEAYDTATGQVCRFDNAGCGFSYRDSMFKQSHGRYLVLRVTFKLHSQYQPVLTYKALEGVPHATADEMRQSIADLRWGKLPRPEEHGSAGSFFKNPIVDKATWERLRTAYPDMPQAHAAEGPGEGYKLSAGWLIDRAGWKGRTMGRAGVWPKQALVLYNTGGCTGDEVMALARAIVCDVKEKYGIALTPEAIII